MIAATGVSRTVVREAVAALRAEGLVITRQGVGAFVARYAAPAVPHRGRRSRVAAQVIEVMELRTGVEVEAAGLAAERATAADLRRDRGRLCRPSSRDRTRRSRRRRGFRLSLPDRGGDRQSAIRALPRIPRPLHHSAPDHPGDDRHGERAPGLSRSDPGRAPRDRGGDPCARCVEGARRDAAASCQQPRAVSEAQAAGRETTATR